MITVVTYNILHGHYKDQILQNIDFIIRGKGVDIICLQEADAPFEKPLNQFLSKNFPEWKIIYAHSGAGGNLALAWNSSRVILEDTKTILLPALSKPSFISLLKGNKNIFQRAAFIGEFSIGGKLVLIANVHLAWEGGMKHRLSQLSFLTDALSGDGSSRNIIAGDFNTFALGFLRSFRRKQIEQTLGPDYKNALPYTKWTADISYTDPQDKWETIAKICRFLHIKLQSRLDYIFMKDLIVIKAEMLDLPGSDHRPLVTRFKI